jgi:hypothetical protein
MLDSWLKPYLDEFSNRSTHVFFEIPMIDSLFARLYSKTIDEGMRRGIAPDKHNNVATYYGPIKKYCQMLSIENRKLGYAFLLDKNGIIQWIGKGLAQAEQIDKMINIAKKL